MPEEYQVPYGKQTMEVSVGKDDEKVSFSQNYNLGDTIEAAVEKFGPDVVFYHFQNSAKQGLRELVRKMMKSGVDPAEIKAAARKWKPSLPSSRRKSEVEKAKDKSLKLSAEERQRLIEELQSSLVEMEVSVGKDDEE